MRKVLGCIKRAQKEFDLICEGDVVAVGVSGGKDSMVLLHALDLYRNFSPVSYELKAITIDMGFEGFDIATIEDFCKAHGIEFIKAETEMGKLIFEDKKENNPCSLCSRMRRGLLNRLCDENGITKLALGHHGDDLIESFLMSMLFESRLNTFKAKTFFERARVIQIRPMIYAQEQDIAEAAEKHGIPSVKNPCPASGLTQRESMKSLTDILENTSGQSRTHIINALCRSGLII
ncbi:MAG: tRNA 2-thiocytidine biosynthesis protein TtcA [Firmicutes bacterium]|nr:tRNA 2-thiocytidine biosynthesis protein TtcA [Clostridiales bacterium]MBQ4340705.1 tRNA 2-thiocytidine biosynthesis protein TtcA [Bacillota bacterium]